MQAESCWVFSGFPPSLILCSSPSGLGAGSYTQPAVGGVLEHALTCTAREKEREREKRLVVYSFTMSVCEVTCTRRETSTSGQTVVGVNTRVHSWRHVWMGDHRGAPLLPHCVVSVTILLKEKPVIYVHNIITVNFK